MSYNDIILVMTCQACPEQYDAFLGDLCIGYLRLRHGYFRVEYNSRLVYEAFSDGDGLFYDESERSYHLENAKKALYRAHFNAMS